VKTGYCKVNITPPLGCCIAGYLEERIADGVADPLYVRAVAFEQDGLAVFLCFDLLGVPQDLATGLRTCIAGQLGCTPEQIFISATHTHTAPNCSSASLPLEESFIASLKHYAVAAAQSAVADLKEAELFFARSELQGIAFVRRFRMKDGSVRTNPGRHNPDILEPMSEPDENIQLLKIVRPDGRDIVLVNFQVHPDVRTGCQLSADYPGAVCSTLEGALPGTDCIYFNGPCGNLNHIDVNCPEWDKNGGPEHVAHMGRTIAGKILSMYTKARPVAAGPVRTVQKMVDVPIRRADPAVLAHAEDYIRWHEAGESHRIPYKGMEYTTAIFEARRHLALRSMPESKAMPVCAAAFGDVAFATVPGEGFCEIGQTIRGGSPFAAQFVLNTTNAYEGYFPMEDAFLVNGYESRTTMFRPGVGELLAEAGLDAVRTLAERE